MAQPPHGASNGVHLNGYHPKNGLHSAHSIPYTNGLTVAQQAIKSASNKSENGLPSKCPSGINAELEALKAELEAAQTDLKAKEQLNQLLNDSKSRLMAQKKELQDQLGKAQEAEKAEKEKASLVPLLEGAKARLMTANADLKKQIEGLRKKVEDAESAKKAIESTITEAELARKTAELSVSHLKALLATREKELAEKELTHTTAMAAKDRECSEKIQAILKENKPLDRGPAQRNGEADRTLAELKARLEASERANQAAEKERAEAKVAAAQQKEQMAKKEEELARRMAQIAEREKGALQEALERHKLESPSKIGGRDVETEKLIAQLRERAEAAERDKAAAQVAQAQLSEQMAKRERDVTAKEIELLRTNTPSSVASNTDSNGGEEAVASPRGSGKGIDLRNRLMAARAKQGLPVPGGDKENEALRKELEQSKKQLEEARKALQEALLTKAEVSKLGAQFAALKENPPASPSPSNGQVQSLEELMKKLREDTAAVATEKAKIESEKAKLEEERKTVKRDQLVAKRESQLAISDRVKQSIDAILEEIRDKRIKFEELDKHFKRDLFNLIPPTTPIIQQRFLEMIRSKGFCAVWHDYRELAFAILDGETLSEFKKYGLFYMQKEQECSVNHVDQNVDVQEIKAAMEKCKQEFADGVKTKTLAEIDFFIKMTSQEKIVTQMPKFDEKLPEFKAMLEKPRVAYARDMKNLQREFQQDYEEPYRTKIAELQAKLRQATSQHEQQVDEEAVERESANLRSHQENINMAFARWLSENVFKKNEVPAQTPSSSSSSSGQK